MLTEKDRNEQAGESRNVGLDDGVQWSGRASPRRQHLNRAVKEVRGEREVY